MDTGIVVEQESICFNNITTVLFEIANMLSIIITDNRDYRNEMFLVDSIGPRAPYMDTRDETLFVIHISKFIDKVKRYQTLIDSILSNRENTSHPFEATWYSLEVIACQLYQLLAFYMGEMDNSYIFDATALRGVYDGVIGYERQIIDIMTFFLVDMMEEISYLIDAMIQNQSHMKNTLIPALNFKTINELTSNDYFLAQDEIIEMIRNTFGLTGRNDGLFIDEIYRMMSLPHQVYVDRVSLRRYNVIKRLLNNMTVEEIREFILKKNDPRNTLFFDYIGPLGKLDILDYVIRTNDPSVEYVIANDYYDNSLLVLYYTNGLSEHILPLEYLEVEEKSGMRKRYIEEIRAEMDDYRMLGEKIKSIINQIQLKQWTCIC